ncbi:MAG TPA: TauD/TfdA family dioxygenase, partial [Burkholderiaceae bacterium]|nr:TauD/TfdA family dioxygenase [Burkholderiaceae bacterium]
MNATLSIRPSGRALAADVEGVDLSRPLDAATFESIRRAWHEHLVLRFRGQRLSDPDLERFSAMFGRLDRAPTYSKGVRVDVHSDFVTVISNVVVDGKPIGDLGNAESLWHTDMSYNDAPPMASALYSLEIPPTGGATGFCNMYLALETMPAPLRERIATLLHSLPLVFACVTHPETGRDALFLGRRRNAWIVGLELAESERLLDEVWAHCTKPELCWYQDWRVGDLILWDNRCTMHRRDEFDPTARRIMHRTQIAGAAPR